MAVGFPLILVGCVLASRRRPHPVRAEAPGSAGSCADPSRLRSRSDRRAFSSTASPTAPRRRATGHRRHRRPPRPKPPVGRVIPQAFSACLDLGDRGRVGAEAPRSRRRPLGRVNEPGRPGERAGRTGERAGRPGERARGTGEGRHRDPGRLQAGLNGRVGERVAAGPAATVALELVATRPRSSRLSWTRRSTSCRCRTRRHRARSRR